MSTPELVREETATTPSQAGSRKRRAFAPLLIGTLLLIVGAGNLWVAEGKTRYYESAFWRSTTQAPARGATRLLRSLPPKVSEYDSLAARRAHSRVEYYGMVANFGCFLMALGSLTALFALTRLLIRRSESNGVGSGTYVEENYSAHHPH
jgi:hypothetical protein